MKRADYTTLARFFLCYPATVVEFWSLLFVAMGTAMFLEGLPWFVAPGAARRTVLRLVLLGDGSLRGLGFALMAVGLVVLWLSTR